jgi:hypothetical protein
VLQERHQTRRWGRFRRGWIWYRWGATSFRQSIRVEVLGDQIRRPQGGTQVRLGAPTLTSWCKYSVTPFL